MDYYESILDTIGNTPLIKLKNTVNKIPALVLAKVETFNPGHSIKDRMAVKMVEDAEAKGLLNPGGTIIECTSGNTGMGLALAGVVKGYHCIFTTNDKQSKEKMDILKAFGAEVIICPTNVTPDDPRSYYSVAEKLSNEIPNSFWCNQYDNLANTEAHYETTGPEIWKQTEGRITHLVVGVGTGGTISGTAKYLKEQNPDIKIWGIDTYGSVFKKYHETGIFDDKEIYPYITEGIGEDILPKNVDFSLIDHFEKVTDKDGAIFARRLAREDGLFLGYSAGSAIAGLNQLGSELTSEDIVVVIFHDHGSRYVAKIFNDDWMRDHGFLDYERTLEYVLRTKESTSFICVKETDHIKKVFELMKAKDISQLPVENADHQLIGSVTESKILSFLLENPIEHSDKPVSTIMGKAFPIVSKNLHLKEISKYISKEIPAVIVKEGQKYDIVTHYDLIHAV